LFEPRLCGKTKPYWQYCQWKQATHARYPIAKGGFFACRFLVFSAGSGNGEHNYYSLHRIELFCPAAHFGLPLEFGAGELANQDSGREWQIR
jgi:hypothetical protein